ncbi:MAG: FGGY-family carbohydrate kinase [Actinomycetota bacterium]|nr:FGGY-family carbohydrate kinase [Actinomycetota bacterium]MDA2971126.1 FGGY-family carbohydrate kinase [Actinomycetota bacterium]MDA3000877.1 FGGY-family carbohydrate kinase [Actinomycetota bacterium]
MSILVIDVGTSGLRAAVVTPDARVTALHHRSFAPSTPAPGLVEFDADEMARHVLEVAHLALREAGPVDGVGITAQRATTIAWSRSTGRALAPGIGWQDLRTVGDCIGLRLEHGLALAPNQTATKARWLLQNLGDHDRSDVCIGTVDSWIAWNLSGAARLHVTDHSNAAVTGLASFTEGPPHWNERVSSLMGVDVSMLPDIVDSSGSIGEASALPGSPVIAALVGDQQASLMGQSCVTTGLAKCTFGTGGMFDMVTGDSPPLSPDRSSHGTFPIVAWSRSGRLTWGSEAIMLSAGSAVEWLVDDMGLAPSAAATHDIASTCPTAEGVFFVPALLGLATPHWDYGARGGIFGLTRGSTRAHIVRAVLEGIAHRGADLMEAALADHPLLRVDEIRIDGGMSQNPTFVAALATATGRPIGVSPVTEATTLGAAFLAGLSLGVWGDLADIAHLWRPSSIVEPDPSIDRASWRGEWSEAVTRVEGWIPDLSALDF